MATMEQFSLRWNNFHSNLTSAFHELLEASEMVDVTLAVDGQFLQAHKIVLSICSPFFRQMFKLNPCKHPIVILNDIRQENMRDILEFMYAGEVKVLRENLPCFLRAAELLQVKGLTGQDSGDTDQGKLRSEDETEEEEVNDSSRLIVNEVKQVIPPVMCGNKRQGNCHNLSPKRSKNVALPNLSDQPKLSVDRVVTVDAPSELVRSMVGGGNSSNYKNTYRCEKCAKKFTRRDHLRTHEKNIHGEDAGPFACVICSQLYKNTESLRKHLAKFHFPKMDDTDDGQKVEVRV